MYVAIYTYVYVHAYIIFELIMICKFKYNYDKDNGEIRIMGALQSTGKKKGPSTGVGGHYNRLVLMFLRFTWFEFDNYIILYLHA
jgi:hypothetical protein